MCERHQLLRQIQMYEFAITEVTLYLDSHPTCPNGLAYYEKYRRLRDEAVSRYEAQFGPLTMYGNQNTNNWTWVSNPWPWEMEA